MSPKYGLTIDDTDRGEGGLLVTINKSKLTRDLDDATANAKTSPSYDAIKELLDDHNAELTDVAWCGDWTCRGVFGCLASPAGETKDKNEKK